VSEEDEAAQRRTPLRRFFLVDPLDGTREFLSRNGEFTVNIALIEEGRPTLGVVCAPALDRLFCGGEGLGAFLEDGGAPRRRIRVRPAPAAIIAVASRSHAGAETEAWLARLPVERCVSVGSSLKLCLVAAGEADVYPRFGRTMEWDIAAGDAVLRAAGGLVTCRDGAALAYGKCGQAQDADYANPHFVAWGDADCRRRFGVTA
jgi:3'(2'),5'-bisphosphate nucleotidase